MQIVVDSVTMKAIDNYTINEIGIPSLVLMERAALAVADCVKEHIVSDDKILAICAGGNNGADGIAAARILKLQGYKADILIIGDTDKCSKEFEKQINIAENLGINIYNSVELNEYTIIIDAIFGIGLNKVVKGEYLNLIKSINNSKHTVFSVDIPSGLSASIGKPLGDAVVANYTVTFAYNKIGLILYPGHEYAGEVIVSDIGLYRKIEEEHKCYIYDNNDLMNLPKRISNSHKGDYGKLLVVAGSVWMNGACYLTSKAAYRMGAGLLKAVIPKENSTIMQTMLAEALISTYESNNELSLADKDKINQDISWATFIVIGPGLGTNKISYDLLKLVLNNAKVPVLIDADGINILAKMINDQEEINEVYTDNINLLVANRLKILKNILPKNVILTPHLKELSRLFNIPLEKIKNNIMEVADVITKDNSFIYVMKDARTVVAHENSRYINVSGNSGMSTAGSGDVLSGIIASLIAQGLEPKLGAELGVYIHGLAGDIATKDKNQYSIIASDIIDGLANV